MQNLNVDRATNEARFAVVCSQVFGFPHLIRASRIIHPRCHSVMVRCSINFHNVFQRKACTWHLPLHSQPLLAVLQLLVNYSNMVWPLSGQGEGWHLDVQPLLSGRFPWFLLRRLWAGLAAERFRWGAGSRTVGTLGFARQVAFSAIIATQGGWGERVVFKRPRGVQTCSCY